MKRTIIINCMILFVLAGLGSTSSFAQKKLNRYVVKNATIVYKHSGMTEGKETHYISDYGKKEARYSELSVSMLGMTTTTKELELIIDDMIYSIDLTEKTGTKSKMLEYSEIDEKQIEEYEDLGKELMEEMGFEMTGTGTVLGKKCEIWEGMGTKTWIWKNIPLKTEINMMGKSIIEATSIDLNAPPASKFKVPDDIDFELISSEDNPEEEVDMEDLEESLNQLKGLLGTKKKK